MKSFWAVQRGTGFIVTFRLDTFVTLRRQNCVWRCFTNKSTKPTRQIVSDHHLIPRVLRLWTGDGQSIRVRRNPQMMCIPR